MMKRVLVGMLAAALAMGLAVSEAQADKKKKGGKKREAAVPTSEKIAESMSEVKWGMSKDELMNKFLGKIKEKYRPLVGKTKDAVEEDRLRQEAKQEMDAIRKGYVEFDGRSSGWNVSFLKGEFTHNNDEAMLVIRDSNSQNFYFFIGGKLWKWYKAFDASVFPVGNFEQFASAVQRRFGPAKEAKGELKAGEGERQWLEWQDKQTRLRAIDETGFYGFYSIVFEDKSTLSNLANLRKQGDGDGDKRHAMVESVTSERTENPDSAPNIVDRITGRLRQNEQAPDPAADSTQAATGKGKSKDKAKSTSSAPVESSDDPISGLGL
jgi:hypothetical protein